MTTFDRWLTTRPDEGDFEPSSRLLADARDQLSDEGGEMPSDEEVYALAVTLAEREAEAAADDAEEHAAESYRDDCEDRFGDGP
jgi:hypothetical protein